MAQGDIQMTVVGNMVADPELKYTQSGTPVVSFRVATTPRVFRDGQWVNGDSTFLTCSLWRDAAENVAESLSKGTRVIVQGRLRQRRYESREGQQRTVYELEVDEVGPSLRFARANVVRSQPSGGASGGGNPGGGNPGGGNPGGGQQTDSDPWGSQPGSWNTGGEQPPF